MIKMNHFLLCILFSVAFIEAIPRNKDLKTEWDTWKNLHGKSYGSKKEENRRFRAYVKNSIFIEDHNTEADLGLHSYHLKMNQFGDMLLDEFLTMFVGKGQSGKEFMKKASVSNNRRNISISSTPKYKNLPKEFDWRSKGAVTPVKNQGNNCPYCSNHFAAIGAIEGALFVKTKKLIPLSVQELIDKCIINIPGEGFVDWTASVDELYEIGGIESEETYPYHGFPKRPWGNCHYNQSRSVAYLDNGCYLIFTPKRVAEDLVTKGPLANFMNVATRSFQFYSKGVYSDPNCREPKRWQDPLNHSALIVGYGITKDKQKYWTVKNSWGTSWGEEGFIRMARDNTNVCGVTFAVGGPAGVHLIET